MKINRMKERRSNVKPIILSIAGLHSFREKQEVDFESLCDGGVFGIFGPTGSGKSSILDAMTLALYGKVERAANQTQGIMNHAEDELSVSFTFELLHATGTKRYIVERSFKRTDDIRLKTASCRLIEKADESFVLADKTGEVNQKIQELLGLTIEDFTRAVVLPQGKFAEFLSLKGVDRRQMLQRLFHLEQYGDELSKKVKARLQEASQKVNELLAEQAGLGDASKEAIDAAEKEVSDLDLLLAKRKKELEQTEKDYENQRKLWQWQIEKQELAAQLQELEKNRDEINDLSNQVARSEEAEKLLPYAEELSQTEERYRGIQLTLESIQESLVKKKAEHKVSHDQYVEANKKRIEEEPALLSQKEKLAGAKELTITRSQLQLELKELKHELRAVDEQVVKEHQLFQENRSLLERGQHKQKELKAQYNNQIISAETREQLQLAREQKQQIAYLNQQVTELTNTVNEKNLQRDRVQMLVSDHEKQEELLRKKLKGSFQQLEKLYEHACEQERLLEGSKQTVESKIEQIRKQMEKERELKLAEHLASRLVLGDPCPVCGSIEHKGPNDLHVQTSDELEHELQQQRECASELHHAIPQLISLKLALEQLSELLVSEDISSSLFSERPISVSQTAEKMVMNEDIQTLLTEIKALSQDVIQQKELIHLDIKKRKQSQNGITEQMQSLKMLSDESNLLNEKLEALKRDSKQASTAWKTDYSAYELASFDQFVSKMMEQDKEAQALYARIEKSVTFLEEKELTVNKARDILTSLEKKQIELQGSVNSKEEKFNDVNTQIHQLTAGEDVDLLVKKIELTHENLIRNEQKTNEYYQMIGQQLQGLEGEVRATVQTIGETEKQVEYVKEKWLKQSEGSSFEHVAAIKAAIISEDKSQEIKEKIQLFLDKLKQTNHELEKVTNQIGNQEITKETWEHTQSLFIEMKEQYQDIIQQKGSANRSLELLKDKHLRFTELEQSRVELGQKVEQLGKLQQVLKGNSFVEFLAEEQLVRVARDASERLGLLTRQRYAIEVDSQGGFIMRDDANGGVRRPVSTLSGGETFLTSLALALALSAQIQLRGEYPLQFFFLDEGFGTLDGDLLDTVITALEKLHTNSLSVGVISHVHELRLRLPKKLIVDPAEPSGRGTRIKLEVL
jgi:exonuclease SbcC